MREAPTIVTRRPLLWTWDFNVEPMVSLVMQQHSDVYWAHKEFWLDEGAIPDMCALFYDAFPNHDGEIWLYGDATSERRNAQTGKTDYYIILQEMKSYGVPIRMRVPEKNPKVPDRINAMNRLLYDEKGNIRLMLDHQCKNLAADLEGVLRDQRGGIRKVTNRSDPYFKRTHMSDAAGYLVAFEEPVRLPHTQQSPLIGRIPRPTYARG